MAGYKWELQGGTATEIGTSDILQFAGATFDSAITVSQHNDSTHVETDVGGDKSEDNGPHNTKYIDSGVVSHNGGGTAAVDSISEANCPLKVNFTNEPAVAVTNHTLYAYDASTTTDGPTDVTFFAAEQGDSTWTAAEGSGSAVSVGTSASGTSHDFFFLVSASPDSVGEKTDFKIRDELTYS